MRLSFFARRVAAPVVAAAVGAGIAACQTTEPARSGEYRPEAPEASNMRLVGYNDLQARSAYMPVIHRQGDRYIAYVGHHGGRRVNPPTGRDEANGTSIVDVTIPGKPRYLAHIAGDKGAGNRAARRWCASATARSCPRAIAARSICCVPSATSRTRCGT